jgi:hypothetical protein
VPLIGAMATPMLAPTESTSPSMWNGSQIADTNRSASSATCSVEPLSPRMMGSGQLSPAVVRTLQIILHGAARYSQPLRDLAAARSVTGKPQHLS